MADYYPVFLDIRGKRSLVVGGGSVAERKARGLLSCGASVTVLSPSLVSGLRQLAEEGSIEVVSRGYDPGDAKAYFVVIAATDDPEVNRQVFADVEAQGGLINTVDDPQHCRFIVPATLERGGLVLAISTAGKSPALAKRVREELEAIFPAEYGEYLEELAGLRRRLRERLADPGSRETVWRDLMRGGLLDLLKRGQLAEAERRLDEIAGERQCFRAT
ncbi:MAG: bifunctional precorrin-2 dehydrogenase/sirohydrochlorin ferrochelatase [Chloroflexi bacterium]|nr:bifunctional precorrin-2 dehydrogenase/sirohydrochlorin ferrochelatase [Chloroflexota bacterium]